MSGSRGGGSGTPESPKSPEKCLSSFTNPTLDALARSRPRSLDEAQRDLDRAIAIARLAERELSDFIYTVTHDLKAPLRSVLTYADFLSEDLAGRLSGDALLFLERLRVNAGQASDQLMSLLELSRIGRWRHPFEMIELTHLVRSVATRFASRFAEQGIECEIADDLPHISGELARVEQLFEIVIHNACLYRREYGGFVRVSAAPPESPGESPVVKVADDGIGIPGDRLEKIFSAFCRLHPGEFEGLGMGLTLARRIMAYHGGEIWVESRIGEGTTTHLVFREPDDNALGAGES